MGGLTVAVHWWEESQLRVLVLTSLLIQFFFIYFPVLRTKGIPGWFRFIMWLAYHKDQGDGVGGGGGSSSNNRLLEVVWAPVLLIHLGGSDGVTAYNIEDNELWTRHLLTVAVYVFSKSWPPGGDKRLLQTAILLFVIGIGKCFMKAWDNTDQRSCRQRSCCSLSTVLRDNTDVRNKKHTIKMRIVSFIGCKDFVDQLFSSAKITHLVLRYLEDGWKQTIKDAASYRSFNNHSSHWGLAIR